MYTIHCILYTVSFRVQLYTVQIVYCKDCKLFRQYTIHCTDTVLLANTQSLQTPTTCSLHTRHYAPHTCKLQTANCTLHTAHCTLNTAHYTLHTAHYKLHTSHYKLDTTHCTLHATQSKLLTTHFSVRFCLSIEPLTLLSF